MTAGTAWKYVRKAQLMCRHAKRILPPGPASVADARRFVSLCAGQWLLSPLLDAALLIVSELVSNAVLHANTPITVTVSCADDTVEIAVADESAGLPMVRPPRHDVLGDIDALLAAEASQPKPPCGHDVSDDSGASGSLTTGRGLLLISVLAAEWGVTPQKVGKAVWARLPAPIGWSPSAGCTCGNDATATLLASGVRARHDADSPSPT